jgi:hypothetical protein
MACNLPPDYGFLIRNVGKGDGQWNFLITPCSTGALADDLNLAQAAQHCARCRRVSGVNKFRELIEPTGPERRSDRYPFTVRDGASIRFSERGIDEWIARKGE